MDRVNWFLQRYAKAFQRFIWKHFERLSSSVNTPESRTSRQVVPKNTKQWGMLCCLSHCCILFLYWGNWSGGILMLCAAVKQWLIVKHSKYKLWYCHFDTYTVWWYGHEACNARSVYDVMEWFHTYYLTKGEN